MKDLVQFVFAVCGIGVILMIIVNLIVIYDEILRPWKIRKAYWKNKE